MLNLLTLNIPLKPKFPSHKYKDITIVWLEHVFKKTFPKANNNYKHCEHDKSGLSIPQ